MEYVIWIFATVVGGVALHVMAHEAYDKAPDLAARLIRCASRRLPSPDNERYQEEWLAHLNDCKGAVTKLLHAIDCLVSARALAAVCLQRSYTWTFSNGIENKIVELDRATHLFVLNAFEKAAIEHKESRLPEIWRQLEPPRKRVAPSGPSEVAPNPKKIKEFRDALGRMIETFDATRTSDAGIVANISSD